MTEHSLTFREFPSLLADLISTREVLTEQLAIAERSGCQTLIQQAVCDLDSCEVALRECVTELVKKADGVAAFIRSEEAGAATAKAEANRCYDLAKAREARADRVKAIALEVLQQLGVKLVKGDVSELRRWGNGGAQPVEVRQPELLPARYQRFEMRITGEEWEELRKFYPDRAKPIEPDTELIRKDLMVKGECPECHGVKSIMVTAPLDEGEMPTNCPTCKAEGWVYVGSVPGAVLVPRSEHLRIK
jgi:hypothetical protein